MLNQQIEGIVGERDALQHKFDTVKQKEVSNNSLAARIDEWQQITIERIKQTADQARKEINQLINSKQNQTLLDFTSFSEQLALLRETENFVETDLATLKQRVDKFELELKELNQSTTFVLKTENSDRIDWTRLIYVETKSNASGARRQESSTGELIDYFSKHVYMAQVWSKEHQTVRDQLQSNHHKTKDQ